MSKPKDHLPQMDPGAYYGRRKVEVDSAVARVLASGWFILGAECAAFEAEFAAAFGFAGAVGVASGTDALVLALKSVGVVPGDRVATVSHTAVATVAAIEIAGATPVLVDIDDDAMTMDPGALRRTLAAGGAKAVVVVHLYGLAAAMTEISAICREFGARLIEDCAQAHGARHEGICVGLFGDAAAFSFYPTKNLGAFGDGGAVASRDPPLLERVRSLREYGWKQRYVSMVPGINSRLDEIQAAILRVRLTDLDAGNARRRAIAQAYDSGLAGASLRLAPRSPAATQVFHQYVIRCAERDRVAAFLRERGVGSNIHYPTPVHLQPAYRARLPQGPDGLANTEAAARSVLSLPMYPEMSDADVARVVATVRDAVI